MFRFTRLKRRIVAMLAVAALLFAQGMIAAHACQALGPAGPAPEQVGHDMPAAGDDSGCAHDSGDGPSAVCHAHCADQAQASDPGTLPVQSATLAPPLAIVPVLFREAHLLPAHRDMLLARLTAPPHAILHCCFRT